MLHNIDEEDEEEEVMIVEGKEVEEEKGKEDGDSAYNDVSHNDPCQSR